MKKKIYIGIDPDLRLLNAVIMTTDPEPKIAAILVRRNKEGSGDAAVANAARMACRLIEDVIAYFVSHEELNGYDEIVLVVESQNVEYTGVTNKARKSSMVQLCQVAGCLMGAFSNMCNSIHLVQPVKWKGSVPKHVHHRRIYKALDVGFTMAGGEDGYAVPHMFADMCSFSHDKVNPGDFKDISDSVGLALFGYRKDLG